MLKQENPTATKLRILVVDDEPAVCESVKLMLSYDGHEVDSANSAEDALEKFDPAKFDLVLTDFKMPGMKGDELAAAVKERCPGKPVILLTAFPPEEKPEAIDLILTKPFYFATLRNALSQISIDKE